MISIRYWFLLGCSCLCIGTALTARAGETVVLYGDSDYAPYSYMEGSEFKGMYVDILREVARRLKPHYTIELVPVPWKRGLLYLQTGAGFGLFPPGFKKEREYITTYSVPLYKETEVLFCTDKVIKRNPKRFPEDFLGLTMGINTGFLLSARLMDAATAGSVKIEEAPGNEANLRKLAMLRLDCYVSDRGAALYTAKKLRDSDKTFTMELHEAVALSGEDTFIGYSGLSTPPYKADFIKKMDMAITAMKREGVIAKIIYDNFH